MAAYRLFVGNLAHHVVKEEVYDIFSKYGEVKSAWVARDPPGFAFVEMPNKDEADAAIHGVAGMMVGGQPIRAEYARPGSERRPPPEGAITSGRQPYHEGRYHDRAPYERGAPPPSSRGGSSYRGRYAPTATSAVSYNGYNDPYPYNAPTAPPTSSRHHHPSAAAASTSSYGYPQSSYPNEPYYDSVAPPPPHAAAPPSSRGGYAATASYPPPSNDYGYAADGYGYADSYGAPPPPSSRGGYAAERAGYYDRGYSDRGSSDRGYSDRGSSYRGRGGRGRGGRGGYGYDRGYDDGYMTPQQRFAIANASDDRTHHKCYNCIAEGSLVTLSNGVSIPIESVGESRDRVLGWQKDNENVAKSGLVDTSVLDVLDQGVKKCIQVTLEDGRTLVCTPDHRILTSDGTWCEAQNLVINVNSVAIGVQYPLYEPDPLSTWRRQYGEYTLRIDNMSDMLRSIAFARVLGLVESDGYIHTSDRLTSKVYLGHLLDVKVVFNDIKLLCDREVAVSHTITEWGSTYSMGVPADLTRAFIACDILTGQRTSKSPKWPSFIRDETCPVVLIRAYLSGLFGGDGHSPRLSSNTRGSNGVAREDKTDLLRMTPVKFLWTKTSEYVDALTVHMNELGKLLDKCGVPLNRTRVYKPTDEPDSVFESGHINLGQGKQSVLLSNHDYVAFSRYIGFYANVHKQQRLAAAASYYSYQNKIKQQFAFVISRIKEICGPVSTLHPVSKLTARIQACNELKQREPLISSSYTDNMKPVNIDHYVQRNTTDIERFNYDNSDVMRVDEWLEKIGATQYFRKESDEQEYKIHDIINKYKEKDEPEDELYSKENVHIHANRNATIEGISFSTPTKKAKKVYAATREHSRLPTFNIRVIDVRDVDNKNVYDLSIANEVNSFLAQGIVVHNCNSFGHRAHECPKPKNQGECYECGSRDHKSRECPNVPPRQRSLFQTVPPDPTAVAPVGVSAPITPSASYGRRRSRSPRKDHGRDPSSHGPPDTPSGVVQDDGYVSGSRERGRDRERQYEHTSGYGEEDTGNGYGAHGYDEYNNAAEYR